MLSVCDYITSVGYAVVCLFLVNSRLASKEGLVHTQDLDKASAALMLLGAGVGWQGETVGVVGDVEDVLLGAQLLHVNLLGLDHIGISACGLRGGRAARGGRVDGGAALRTVNALAVLRRGARLGARAGAGASAEPIGNGSEGTAAGKGRELLLRDSAGNEAGLLVAAGAARVRVLAELDRGASHVALEGNGGVAVVVVDVSLGHLLRCGC